MLTPRQADILRIVTEEHIRKGLPVASELVVRAGLGVSPATVRYEMAALEEKGYLRQPHTSAGRIPSDLAYRHYVESIIDDADLPVEEQRLIRHQFHQVQTDIEEWTRLAAAVLSGLLRNVAIVTVPKTREAKLKHIELVALHDLLVLLIVILAEAKPRQQALSLSEPMSTDGLYSTARRLNDMLSGLGESEIQRAVPMLTGFERQVAWTVLQVLESERQQEYDEPHVDGLRHMLAQPEFATIGKIAAIVEFLEQKSSLRGILPRIIATDGVRVVIGRENEEEAMRECSMVVTRYGIPGEIGGAIGVIGPTRLQYRVAIPAVQFLSGVMGELVGDLYG